MSIVLSFLTLVSTVDATQKTSDSSARIAYLDLPTLPSYYMLKKMAIANVLKRYNSVLLDSSASFVTACQIYNLDCYLLPSITGVESYFGTYIHPNSYNPFGWGGGYIMFRSWNEGIHTVAKGLRENYLEKGSTTIEKIGPIYATTQSWAPKVNHFRKLLQEEEDKLVLYFQQN